VLSLVEKALRTAVATLVVTIVVMVGAQVVFRYAVKAPIVWSEEFTTLCYQWLSFLGAALAVRYRAHFGVDFAVRHLGPTWQARLAWLGHVVVWLLGIFMIFYGWRIVESSAVQMYPTLPWSVGTGYAIVPITGVLFLLMDLAVIADRRAGRPVGGGHAA
jgi:TRAP-type C4-dicarboxylate transport system permease small subunit